MSTTDGDGTVFVYARGMVSCSACVPEGMSREVIERKVNDLHPTGIDSRWSISDDPTFATGQPNPCVCESDSDRRHYLLNC